MLFTHRKVGVLTSASVVPDARGRGIQRGLIAARSQRAIELGCDLLVIEAAADNVASIRNAERLGFAELSRRSVYRFDPETEGERVIEETRAAVGAWLPLPPRELAATRPG
jgi:ribosomal protein S18 acetylase RimI-like enzyme